MFHLYFTVILKEFNTGATNEGYQRDTDVLTPNEVHKRNEENIEEIAETKLDGKGLNSP